MRQLTLIRHGSTEWNESGKFQGHSDTELSEEGKLQAEALRARLAKLERDGLALDWVVSSPLKRAYRTAELALPGRDIQRDARLKELNFGAFEGREIDIALLCRRAQLYPVWRGNTDEGRSGEDDHTAPSVALGPGT